QHRRGAGLAALLPGRQDPGVQQRRHRQRHHAPVQGAGIPGQLRVPQRGARQHPGADDRRRGRDPPRLQEGRDPGRLHQLRPARPRGPGKGPGRQGHQAGGRREIQHQGRRHDGPAAQGQGRGRRSRSDLRHRSRTGADRQRHGQAGSEGADHRQSDAVDGQLHRQLRR
ncbi:hypothetical protein OY671_011039, partial [Metschnikowia pulcherrima]